MDREIWISWLTWIEEQLPVITAEVVVVEGLEGGRKYPISRLHTRREPIEVQSAVGSARVIKSYGSRHIQLTVFHAALRRLPKLKMCPVKSRLSAGSTIQAFIKRSHVVHE